MFSEPELAIAQADTELLLRRYTVAAPLMEQAFGAML